MIERKIGCDKCVLIENYAGTIFKKTKSGEKICNFCNKFKKQKFLGETELIKDLSLDHNERIGVTVSGGKDSLYVWLCLVEKFGPERVIAFNHKKVGLVHPLAEENLKNSEHKLDSELIYIEDYEFLPRFKNNIHALLSKPDAAMVRVALCAGCRIGISDKIFQKAKEFKITKIINGASYLELAPFKRELMLLKGGGFEKRGLLYGLLENPLYYFPGNLATIMIDDEHCHVTELSAEKRNLYPGITYLDFYKYFPNTPTEIKRKVKDKLGWKMPAQENWHFDCLVEPFKDLFYYGLLGYTEIDYKLSEMVRYNLVYREEALKELYSKRKNIIENKECIFKLLEKINCADLIPQLQKFIEDSKYLS